MLGPDSRLLTVLLIALSAALLVAAIRYRLLPVRILCGSLSIMVAMTGGIAAVNYYYGYYTTWGQLWSDFHGGGAGDLGTVTAVSLPAVGSGRIGWVDLYGQITGYHRKALIYLPPQYGQAQYAHVRFPVVELFHGTPGTPRVWNTLLPVTKVMDSLLARHLIGPMVLVMPAINGPGSNYEDCVNGPTVKDETYLTEDVRADVLARYRVSHDPYEWGLSGYSSGGYCAANLALRHRGSYGAAAVINGYFRAADGPAAAVLNHSKPLEVANSPLYTAERLTADSGPLPAFWMAAGIDDTSDYKPATVFASALDRFEQVPFVKLNAGDTANAWQAALPAALTWLWQQLAPPDLRVLFPVRTQAPTLTSTLPVDPAKTHHPAYCKPAMPIGHGRAACLAPPGHAKHEGSQTIARLSRRACQRFLDTCVRAASGASVVPGTASWFPAGAVAQPPRSVRAAGAITLESRWIPGACRRPARPFAIAGTASGACPAVRRSPPRAKNVLRRCHDGQDRQYRLRLRRRAQDSHVLVSGARPPAR